MTESRHGCFQLCSRHIGRFTLRLFLLLMIAAAAVGTPVRAQQTAPATSSTAATDLEPEVIDAPVVVWNRTITTLHAPLRGHSASDRAEKASQRIAALIDRMDPKELDAEWMEVSSGSGVVIRVGNRLLFAILPADVPGGNRAAAEKEGSLAVQRLREIVTQRTSANRPTALLKGIGLALAATLALIALYWLLTRADRIGQRQLVRITDRRISLNLGGFDLRPVIWGLLRKLIQLIRFVLLLFFGYLWLSFVLRQFPYSQPWGERLGTFLVEIALRMGHALLRQIPNVLTLIVIFVITRSVVRLINAWFGAVETGTVQVGWLEGPAARVTRRLISVGIWLFALIIAYPYIPGAGSDAFKGVSVLVGLMVSLGSAGVVTQVVSGLVVLYSRAIKVGDFVRVGEYEGVVQETGTLSMKLLTRTHEQIAIPNSVLSTTPVRNFTRESRSSGLLITTGVTIGYDTPWRQVVALLELAASRTPGLLKDPKPFVFQTALTDFYAEYQLNVAIAEPPQRYAVLSQLHQEIQDAFNEYGVQIMSPNFRSQPEDKVWVPSGQWYEKPATPPHDAKREPGAHNADY